MIITIHQPNFIPWYPFFQKMEQADLFILLGHCQFEKNGFQNRFQLENTWNTLSVKKGKEPIIEKEYINPKHDWMKIKKRLFKYKNVLNELDPFINKNLYKTNKDIITNFIASYGGRTRHINEVSIEEQKDLGLL